MFVLMYYVLCTEAEFHTNSIAKTLKVNYENNCIAVYVLLL